jgi:hypothetical protein
VYASNIKRWEVVDKAIKEWIGKMEALVKMWVDQAGKLWTRKIHGKMFTAWQIL